MTLKNKSILITGGAGFIGSHLIDRLIKEKPSNLVVVDNFFLGKESNLREAKENYPQLKVYNRDASNFAAMTQIMMDNNSEVVFNLAIIPLPACLEDPYESYWQNVDLALCLCELARMGLFKTLVHISSSEAYGECQYTPMDEDHPLNPTTPYGASKAATDLLVLSYVKAFGIDASILRPFNNYGPRQNDGSYAGVVPLTIKRILSGEVPVIYGDGNQTRDFTYVTDTVEAAVECYNRPETRGEVINVGSGTEVSVNALVGLISRHTGCGKPPIHEGTRAGDVRRLVADISRAKVLLGFEPKVELGEGLKKTVEYYRGKR